MSVPYDFFDYPEYWGNRRYEDQSERLALNDLFKVFQERKTIVDIGGGYGRLADFYAPIFENCTILEPSEKLIGKGKEYLKNIKNISFVRGSFPSLPLKENSFEVAIMIRVLHHLDSSLIPIREIFRILRPGGYFILEIANKIHFLARVKAFFQRDFSFTKNRSPLEKRSLESIKEDKITFLNHHPEKVIEDLSATGFSIVEILSVSNFRSPFLKKIFPIRFLLFFEKITQKPLAKVFFGPSLFLLAKKVK